MAPIPSFGFGAGEIITLEVPLVLPGIMMVGPAGTTVDLGMVEDREAAGVALVVVALVVDPVAVALVVVLVVDPVAAGQVAVEASNSCC